jgi:hypothetical protein
MSLLLSFIFMSSIVFFSCYLFIFVCFYLKVVHAIFNFFLYLLLFDACFDYWVHRKVKQIRIPLIYIYIYIYILKQNGKSIVQTRTTQSGPSRNPLSEPQRAPRAN